MAILVDPEFFKKLDENPIARDFFLNNQTVKHIVKRIRDDDSFFIKYQHNQDIVKFVNLFVNSSDAELPDGWKELTDNKKRSVYANTRKKFTSYYHPKVIENLQAAEQDTSLESDDLSDAPVSQASDIAIDNEPLLEYPDQVVIFLERNSNDKLLAKLPAINDSPNLQKILEKLRTEGTARYERYVNVGAFAQFLSFFDSEITAITYDHLGGSQATSRPSAH